MDVGPGPLPWVPAPRLPPTCTRLRRLRSTSGSAVALSRLSYERTWSARRGSNPHLGLRCVSPLDQAIGDECSMLEREPDARLPLPIGLPGQVEPEGGVEPPLWPGQVNVRRELQAEIVLHRRS